MQNICYEVQNEILKNILIGLAFQGQTNEHY